jgi:hypothetical protein
MKLIRLIGAFLFFSQMAMALNFNGVQTLNGLNTTPIFTAPASGIYFINGQLTLPGLPGGPVVNGAPGPSQVVAVVSKNYITSLYTGLAGATGFQIMNQSLVSNDLITVGLSSIATIDQVSYSGLNAVKGQVYFGNTF